VRLLIVGGGTGGHIYPALAVARSLQARPDAPALRWVGGHRGLEAQVIPATGIPFRRLLVRSLRSVDLDFHVVLDPIRLSLSVPQAMAMLLLRRPAAIFTTGGYVALPVLMAAAALRIPVVMWDGNVVPGRSVRVTADWPAASRSRSRHLPRPRPAARPCFVTGTPIRDPGWSAGRGPRRRSASRPKTSCS
jgi:UDP-N-acetylglucosamine--N-acetylmuramyl-(pentapeptide) pyrophosphoryl-undecaprenol N-acetylglucosamine transferase